MPFPDDFSLGGIWVAAYAPQSALFGRQGTALHEGLVSLSVPVVLAVVIAVVQRHISETGNTLSPYRLP